MFQTIKFFIQCKLDNWKYDRERKAHKKYEHKYGAARRLKQVENQRDTYLKELNLYHANCECGVEEIGGCVEYMKEKNAMLYPDTVDRVPLCDDGPLSKPD